VKKDFLESVFLGLVVASVIALFVLLTVIITGCTGIYADLTTMKCPPEATPSVESHASCIIPKKTQE
jgi:hypothetical protein